MTPAARIAAAIELLAAIEAEPKRPADAVANDFFRARRFIGSGDRRSVSDRVWRVLRAFRRLRWWLAGGPEAAAAEPAPPAARRACWSPASLLTEGGRLARPRQAFSGDRFAPAPLSHAETTPLARIGHHTLDHPAMPEAVRFDISDWLLPRLAERFGPDLPAEMAAILGKAPLDLRANLLKTSREDASAALAREGMAGSADPLLSLGLADRGPPPDRLRSRFPVAAWWKFRTRAAS